MSGTFLASANANRPKGDFADSDRNWSLAANDQLMKASEYAPLVIAYKNGGAVKLSDVANVTDSIEDIRTAATSATGNRAIILVIFRQPGANIIDTVDRILAAAAAVAGIHSRRPFTCP